MILTVAIWATSAYIMYQCGMFLAAMANVVTGLILLIPAIIIDIRWHFKWKREKREREACDENGIPILR